MAFQAATMRAPKMAHAKPALAVTGGKFPWTLEDLFTHPAFWGVTTATPVQRAKCRILEGRPVGDLKNHPDVLELCNGPAPDFSKPPREILDISAVRIGKSLWAACSLFWMSQTVDLTSTRESDIVRVFIVALSIKGCDAIVKHLVEALTNRPALRPFLVDPVEDISIGTVKRMGLRIRRPHDGRVVEFVCIPLDKGGGSAVSVFCAGIAVDEYPRMAGEQDGVRNVDHLRDAIQARMLPGAVQIYTGSPWQPYGPAYDNTVKHFGKPTKNFVVLRTSAKSFVGIKGCSWTKDLVETLRETPGPAYKTDYLAEFADGEEAVFPGQAIDDAVQLPRPDDRDLLLGRPAIFADPSALRRDFWTCMVGGWVLPKTDDVEDVYETEAVTGAYKRGRIVSGRNGGWIRVLEDENGRPIPKVSAVQQRPYFKVFEIKSWDKASGARGTDLVKAVGALARKYGCEDFHWDGYEQLMLGDLIRQQGLRPIIHPWGNGANAKTPVVDHMRTLFVERRIQLPSAPPSTDPNEPPPPAHRLKMELQRFRARPTPGGGFSYVVAGGAGHGDHALALLIAMRADLDGYLDRSPTAAPTERYALPDYAQAP